MRRSSRILRDRLVALGWSSTETIADDLGCSAVGGVTRTGFDRLLEDVAWARFGPVFVFS